MQLAEITKEIEELREDAFRFGTKLNSVQNELYKAQKELRENGNINTLENQALRKELDDKNRECEKLLAMIEELKITESEISNKLNAEQKKVEELTNELMESRKKQVNVDKLNKKIIEELNEKYKEIEGKYEEANANKTTEFYKRYSDDKEKYYLSECERIKREYAEEYEKIQSKVNEEEKQYIENLKKIEQEYESKIDVLKRKLEKSQKRCK